MATATENTIPLTAEQVGLLSRAMRISGDALLDFWFGFDEVPHTTADIERVEQAGHTLLLYARLMSALQRGEFPLDADARALLAEWEKEQEHVVDEHGLGEDLVISQGRLAMLRAILDFAENPPRGGGA